jgi:hypothetical protein
MRAGWVPQEIVFAARGTGPFLIAYGNVAAASSALPVTTLVPGYASCAEPLAVIAVAHMEPRRRSATSSRRNGRGNIDAPRSGRC